ncbi:hypothetical protein ACRB68_21490 [Actinomadura sp. RB68]|uniref:AAA+ ATPase domain-containing protein n=1 Tax=Actinomadura macrotermitis TaxID=2585200 RepID=A0A7K0BSD9_9ACTN|nr:hypothetical protein [Actinomadura macrotermitis]
MLTSLGPQRFEELSQALALQVLGPSVEIFGDGPDGGREASFENLTHFPTAEAPWHGYGILQAKFRKRPERSKDADWLIEQIGAELRAWANPRSHRVTQGRIPKYLLITTNVILTAVPGRGGIARVDEAIQRYAHDLGLPLLGWEIWHYDKICRLLDEFEGIRHANADAVLPGDVLSRLYDHLERIEATHSPALGGPGLPSEMRPLVGREVELVEGGRRLQEPEEGQRPAIVVTGAPGIGKSALALRLARLAADAYPDGQFHIDLSLWTAGNNQVDLVQVLLQTLRPSEALPEGRARQIIVLRSLLSRCRVLLLMDDIASEEALAEILQMDGPFAIVCTSRAKLSGLTGYVHFIELSQMPVHDGTELVRAISGPDRLTSEQVSALVEACAGHPLALHVATAHLARRPRANIDRLIADITNPERGVRALRAGQTALEPVLESSFTALSSEQADLFITLGILPYMSVTADVVAATTVEPHELDNACIDDVIGLLDSLFELSLIEQVEQDRFVLHEILHRFARLKSASATPKRREEVIRRACLMLAARTNSASKSIGFDDKNAIVPAQSNEEALLQLNTDRPGCIALAEQATHDGLWEQVGLLAATITPSMHLGGRWKEIERLCRCLLEAGTATGNSDWTVSALHNLGLAAAHLGDSEDAASLLQRSAETARAAEDPFHYFMARFSFGTLLINLGLGSEAIPHLRCGLRFWRSIDDRLMLSRALQNLGQANLIIGRLNRAERYIRNSRELCKVAGLSDFQGREALATLLRHSGRMAEAAQETFSSLIRARIVGDRGWEAQALMELAETPENERPVDAPTQPVETALNIYRDMGDIQGQVRALFQLGRQAAEQAELQQAIECFTDCVNLATGIGDHLTAAQAASTLATFHGGVGHLEEAEAYFADAREMADYTGSPLVIGHVLRERAQYLRHQGLADEAAARLTEAVRLLETTEDRAALTSTRVALGEALVVSGRWQEGAKELEPIAALPENEASPSTKAQALRSLSVLYSRRGLHREAETAVSKALDQVERIGDKGAILACRMALANMHARNQDHIQALEQYDKAIEAALELKDLHVLLTAQAMASTCRLTNGEKEKAFADMTKLLPLAERLGMQAVKTTLHANIGVYHSHSGDHEQALTEFRTALSITKSLGDGGLRASCLLNLARSHQALSQTAAAGDYARQAFTLHQQLGGWKDAAEAIRLLLQLHWSENSGSALPSVNELLGDEQPVDGRTLEAWHSLVNTLKDSALSPQYVTNHPASTNGRTINLSAEVQRELAGIDAQLMIQRLSNSRQSCLVCGLAIDEQGRAELFLLLPREGLQLTARLTHPHCGASKVVRFRGKNLKEPQITMETECIIFGDNIAGIIVDCYGGWGFVEGKGFEDLILGHFRRNGFVDLQATLEGVDGPMGIAELAVGSGAGVRAHLKNNILSLTASQGEVLVRMPLDFLPCWYRKAAEGTLIVLVGRNLQGMAAEDMSYLSKAISAGNVVGGAAPLTVIRPSRNTRCPCMSRKGRKFKHCCGRRRTEG